MQVQQLQRKILRDTVLSANSCYFFACMHCAKNVPDKRLRTAENNAIVCGTCQSEDSIAKINIIGRVVSISQRKFYLCPFCMVVHEWLSCGYELTRCPHTPKLLSPARACVICGFSPSSLNTVTARLAPRRHAARVPVQPPHAIRASDEVRARSRRPCEEDTE